MTWVTRLTSAGRDEILVQPSCYGSEGCLLAEEQKRVQNALLPCTCQSMAHLLDLGREYSPRYLPSLDCVGSCWHDPYRCHHRFYEVKVLKRRDKADEVSRRHDPALPESLRDIWKFVSVKVVVSCECSL